MSLMCHRVSEMSVSEIVFQKLLLLSGQAKHMYSNGYLNNLSQILIEYPECISINILKEKLEYMSITERKCLL